MTFAPSEFQEKIFKHSRLAKVRRAKGKSYNFQCQAVAGSGKSTTLRMIVDFIKKKNPDDSVLVLQFNTHIKNEMAEQLKDYDDVTVLTSHSAGNAVLKRSKMKGKGQISKSKYYGICRTMIEDRYNELINQEQDITLSNDDNDDKRKESKRKNVTSWTSQLTEVVKMAMNTLSETDYISLFNMIDHHGITVKNSLILNLVKDVLDTGTEMAKKGTIGFEDMIYLPVIHNMKFPKYNWVLCDESQDFNNMQWELVTRHVDPKDGIIGFFGDDDQSIMGWAGALSGGMGIFQEKMKARILPLSICYRCPSKALELARILVPHIQDRPNCPEGIVECIKPEQIITHSKPGDFILCRLTAPLVKTCIEFIKRNIRAKVKGRDLGKKLSDLYKEVVDEAKTAGERCFTTDEFIGFLRDYSKSEVVRATTKKESSGKIEAMKDNFAALEAVASYVSSNHKGSAHSMIDIQIGYIFSEEVGEEFITLLTVHRSKGLEAKRVTIIEFDKMPLRPRKPEKKEFYKQEASCMYVALTRVKDELYIQGKGMETIDDVKAHIRYTKSLVDNHGLNGSISNQKEDSVD